MSVPLLDLRAQYERLRREIEPVVAEVFESQRFIGGPHVEALEQAIAGYCEAREAVAVASGTDALLLLLKAAGVGPGDEVITSPFTFFATAGAVVNVGATPVFVDIDPETYNLSAPGVEAAISHRTKAVIPVHLFGHCADMAPMNAAAKRHNLTVIEDAAQSIGARYYEGRSGNLGDAGAISFFPSKNLGGAGDGGMVTAMDAALADRVRLLRNHGDEGGYMYSAVGTNSRLDALQAAVLCVKLRHLDTWIAERRANAEYYNARFADVEEIVTPVEREGCYHVYNQYVIRLPERDRARQYLGELGIGCAVYYPLPLHRQECFAHLGYHPGSMPESNRASEEVLALPVFPELTREQQDEVVAAVKQHLAAV